MSFRRCIIGKPRGFLPLNIYFAVSLATLFNASIKTGVESVSPEKIFITV